MRRGVSGHVRSSRGRLVSSCSSIVEGVQWIWKHRGRRTSWCMQEKNKPEESSLNRARLAQGLSQQALGDLVGVSKKTIARWEQGKQLPFAYNRPSLAKHLKMTPEELDILLQRRESEAPSVRKEGQEQSPHRQWFMPHPRNEFFTAREEVLAQLNAAFSSGKSGIVKQVLSGLPGVGKTQIAIEYAYRYRETYQTILWVTADTKDSMLSDFVRITSLLRLPQRRDPDKWRAVDAVKKWLNSHADWLLVLDNVDDPNVIRDFLPQEGDGHLLLTTRDSEGITTLSVRKMEIEDGATLLLRRAGLHTPKEQHGDPLESNLLDAKAVLEVMDGLPLALDQAGAYIAEAQCSIAEYLKFYGERRKKLLDDRGRNHSGHPLSFVTTLSLSVERLELENALAADILHLCAFLHPDDIPEEFFMTGDVNGVERFQPLASSEFLLTEAIRGLLRYSLVYRLKDTKAIGVHRLVQDVLRDHMGEEIQRRWAEYAVGVLSQLFFPLEEKAFNRYERYIAHALICLDYIDTWELFDEHTFRLLFLSGFYLRERGLYAQAEPVCQHTLDIAQRIFPSNSAFITMSLENLAVLFTEQGDYDKAEVLYRRASESSSSITDTALKTSILYERAYLYKRQGKYIEALSLAQRLFTIVETLSEWESQIRINALTFLAELYCILDKYELASSFLMQAITTYTSNQDATTLDGTHLLNIVLFYLHRQGRDSEATLLCQPVLEMAEALWGPQHPDTARICINVAEVYIGVRNMVKAEQCCKRAIEIYQAIDQAMQLPRPLCYLAVVCISRERYFEAEAYFKQAQAIVEEKSGPEDKQMHAILTGYINLYRLMQRDEEAEMLEKKVQSIENWQQ
jgi:tetratricopeptide (TPR) repeat protein/transcriptional regulator with XRE-family HTH domain